MNPEDLQWLWYDRNSYKLGCVVINEYPYLSDTPYSTYLTDYIKSNQYAMIAMLYPDIDIKFLKEGVNQIIKDLAEISETARRRSSNIVWVHHVDKTYLFL